jgi:hypothetical protein
VTGISDKVIAGYINMSTGGLAQLVATQEYKDYEACILQGHITDMDKALAGKTKLIHEEVRQAVPAALRCLVDTVSQRRDLKAAMSAAKEILDRDPDRTLVVQDTSAPSESEAVLPEGVLNKLTEEGNRIAQEYEKSATPTSGKVN